MSRGRTKLSSARNGACDRRREVVHFAFRCLCNRLTSSSTHSTSGFICALLFLRFFQSTFRTGALAHARYSNTRSTLERYTDNLAMLHVKRDNLVDLQLRERQQELRNELLQRVSVAKHATEVHGRV